MQPISKRLKDLEAFLDDPRHDIGTMTLSEFDGFIAGIVVCPDLIMPSEWLPEIWGDGPEFVDEAEAQRVFGQIMEHYNGVIHALDRPGAYAPIFAKDTDGTVLWELWASGFGRAMDLREEAWHVFAEHGDGDTAGALMALIVLTDLADADTPDDSAATRLVLERMNEDGVEEIGPLVERLNAARLAIASGAFVPSGEAGRGDMGLREPPITPKVGRNDPCPCGSGKKFKKCCLH